MLQVRQRRPLRRGLLVFRAPLLQLCVYSSIFPPAYILTSTRQAARSRVERMPASPHHREYVATHPLDPHLTNTHTSQTVLPLPGPRPRASRLPDSPPQRRRHKRSLLLLRSRRPSCAQLPDPRHGTRRTWSSSRRLRRRVPRRVCGWRGARRGDVLQVRWAESLCARLSGAGDEVLRVWKAR